MNVFNFAVTLPEKEIGDCMKTVKRYWIYIILIISLVFSACTLNNSEGQPVEDDSDIIDDNNQNSYIANPWTEVTKEDVEKGLGTEIVLPHDAKNVIYRFNSSIELYEILFDYDVLSFTYRIKKSAETEDISGLYYEWTNSYEETVEGYKANIYRVVIEDDAIELITWIDTDEDISYSLSTSLGADLDGFYIEDVVKQLIKNGSEDFFEEDNGKIYCYDSEENYDYNDDSSLKNGIRKMVNNSEEEKEFIDSIFDSGEQYRSYEYPESTVYLYDSDDESKFVFVTNHKETEYSKEVYGIIVDKKELELEARYDADSTAENIFDNLLALNGKDYSYADCLRPYAEYQETYDYVTKNNQTVSYRYEHDSQIYGTYNSSGIVYVYDNKACYKEYYVTSGSKSIYYIYNENGQLSILCDFGGMAYKGMEDNPDTEIGFPFKVYYFE